MKYTIAIISMLMSGAGIAGAQTPDLSLASKVAGYKAAFTCSAHFNAGKTQEQIAEDELHDFYPDYRAAMAEMPPAVIDEENKTVSVAYSDNTLPRISAWRPFLGCAQLPTGAALTSVKNLPRVKVKQNRRKTPPLETALNDNEFFNAVVGAAFDGETYGERAKTSAVVIVHDGKIIAEQYIGNSGPNVPQRTWSVAKSIAVTIIGAAVEKDIIALDDPAIELWRAPGDPRGAITFNHLLHMSSGLTSHFAGNRTDDIYFGGGRVIDHAITNRLVAKPGTRWRYANNDTMAAMRGLREYMGDSDRFLRFPFESVLHPVGMDHTFLETDWNGDFVLSSQVWTTARDLARLGLLYLNDGVWQGQRILPEGWVEYVATPAPDQPGARSDGSPRPGYGAQFWLFGESWGLPDGSFAAMGNRGQFVMIIPERNIVIVRRGYDDSPAVRFNIAEFSADVLEALEE